MSTPIDLDDDPEDWHPGDPAEFAATSADPLAALLELFAQARPDWHDDAACRDTSIDFTSKGAAQRARAFDTCGSCEVRGACLDWALDIGDDVAILGGLDPAARRRIAAQRQRDEWASRSRQSLNPSERGHLDVSLPENDGGSSEQNAALDLAAALRSPQVHNTSSEHLKIPSKSVLRERLSPSDSGVPAILTPLRCRHE